MTEKKPSPADQSEGDKAETRWQETLKFVAPWLRNIKARGEVYPGVTRDALAAANRNKAKEKPVDDGGVEDLEPPMPHWKHPRKDKEPDMER